jgi:hypothetical protein
MKGLLVAERQLDPLQRREETPGSSTTIGVR